LAVDLSTFELLLGPRGSELMGQLGELDPAESELAIGTRLRRNYPTELVAAALTQHRLRTKAVTKFGDLAANMWFTADALEQATRRPVATHRANRLVDLGATSVVDLGCGIGGDLIAFARAGLTVRGIEADPVRAAIAQANLAAAGFPGTVEVGDATLATINPTEVAFVDPARRDGRGRTFSLDALVPSWEFVTELLQGRALAKVMPGIAHDAVPPGVHPEWVSDSGDLVEACLWGAGFALPHNRQATVLPAGATLLGRHARADTGEPLTFLIEPDDAVIRAGLVAELAQNIGGHLLDPHIAWITSTEPYVGPLGRCFEVVEELPYREKQLKAALRAKDIGTLTVKKRGVQVVPEQLIKRLGLKGSKTAIVVLTRVNEKGRAFLVTEHRNGELDD